MEKYCKQILFIIIVKATISFSQHYAIMDFIPSEITSGEAITLTNKFRYELAKNNYFKVFEREELDKILTEQGFQKTGCTTDQCAVEIGKLAGVNKVIVGSVGKVGKLYSLITRVVDVETGEVVKVTETSIQGSIEDLYLSGVRDNVQSIVNNSTHSDCSIATSCFIKSKTDSVNVLSSPDINSNRVGNLKSSKSYNAQDFNKLYWQVCVDGKLGFVPKAWVTKK